MDLSAFHHGQPEESQANGGEEVGENVPAEGEKLKKRHIGRGN